ncbi:MAG TPA: glycosyltransferase family 4 protein, partial [Candidatus Hydrogenedentes bacterium]|nr:glycosyltransferase family 4 protein [Candidatus Hydrogenedentota bacterium]
EEGSQERGVVHGMLPFPVTPLSFPHNRLNADAVAARFREAVTEWGPDVVLLTHGFCLKPHVARALAGFPLVGRYYAHELMCARDGFRHRDGAPCPNDFLRTPGVCRDCAAESLRPEIASGEWRTWVSDYVAAQAWRPRHHETVTASLAAFREIVVSNRSLREELLPHHPAVTVIPGGVNADTIPRKDPARGGSGKRVILMTGRVEDPRKGLGVLLAAGELLARKRDDFEIRATHFDLAAGGPPWYRPLGWMSHAEALSLYQGADIAVVPSLWREPFGLVAVEAMAAGLPVVASDTGGLSDIVLPGETGLLVPPGDEGSLAAALETLLDGDVLRARLGAAGRARAEAEHDWQAVVRRHYLPLVERTANGRT